MKTVFFKKSAPVLLDPSSGTSSSISRSLRRPRRWKPLNKGSSNAIFTVKNTASTPWPKSKAAFLALKICLPRFEDHSSSSLSEEVRSFITNQKFPSPQHFKRFWDPMMKDVLPHTVILAIRDKELCRSLGNPHLLVLQP